MNSETQTDTESERQTDTESNDTQSVRSETQNSDNRSEVPNTELYYSDDEPLTFRESFIESERERLSEITEIMDPIEAMTM